jgi:hypothetical protein
MRTLQVQASNMFLQAERVHQASALTKLLAFFSNLLNGRARVEGRVAGRYEGCAWCDSTEHQITRDIIRF